MLRISNLFPPPLWGSTFGPPSLPWRSMIAVALVLADPHPNPSPQGGRKIVRV